MIILVLIFLIFLLFVLTSYLHFYNDFKRINVPGPRPIPILGNAHLFIGDSTAFLRTLNVLRKEYGKVFCAYLLKERYVVLSDPKYVEMIVSSSEFTEKSYSYDVLRPWLGLGLLTSSGQRWKTHRKFLTPAFHFNILKSFLPVFVRNQQILINKLQKISDGTSRDIFPIIAVAALDNITESAMGVSIRAQDHSESDYVKAVNELSEILCDKMRNPLLTIESFFYLHPNKKKQDKYLSILHGQTDKVIEERRKYLQDTDINVSNYYDPDLGTKNQSSFLDLMLLSKIHGVSSLDQESIRSEVDTFMFEGHDTTTSAICFTLYCLSNNQRVQDKLYKEQLNIFGKDKIREPNITDLNEMKYLELAIKESLRLYPSVPFIARKAVQDSHVGEFKIPKDTNITIDIFHMQRDASNFEDPLEYIPERFETTRQSNIYSMIAFSAGPRNCIGQKFAMMEMKVIISGIIRHFEILPSGVEPILCSDLILKSRNGVNIKLVNRE